MRSIPPPGSCSLSWWTLRGQEMLSISTRIAQRVHHGLRDHRPKRIAEAGLVLDHLGEARLKRVVEGTEALDDAVSQAKEEKARQARRKELPADLGALVDADELTIEDAELNELPN